MPIYDDISYCKAQQYLEELDQSVWGDIHFFIEDTNPAKFLLLITGHFENLLVGSLAQWADELPE